MRILVTGGSGFVGTHTVAAVLAAGHEPRILDLVPSPAHPPDTVDTRTGDILDARTVRDAVRGCDAVIHLAAVADVNDVLAAPADAERLNVEGTRRVFEAAREAGAEHVSFASTVWVYGNSNGRPFIEDDTPAPPGHPYVATKLAGERLCAEVADAGLPVAVCRLGIPYGPGARPATVLATFAAQAAAGRPITVSGDGSQSRPFVYVEDLARGIVLATLAGRGRVYNLAGAEPVPVLRLAHEVRAALRSRSHIVHTVRRPGDLDALWVSSERARRELGWRPQVALQEGIARYVGWLEMNPDGEA
jgi:UDP-glucose 4-epimerase